jgi:hypothetical protein
MKIQCPKCQNIQEASAFCANCGVSFNLNPKEKLEKGWYWKPLFLGLSFIIVAVTVAVIADSRKSPKEVSPQVAISTPMPEPRTPAELLERAKLVTGASFSPTALSYLQQIPKNSKEYAEAQKLIKIEQDKQKKQIEREEVAAKQYRIEMAAQLEKKMLSQGYDFYITVEGTNNEVMRVKYILTSRPMVYKIINETDFSANLRLAGFKKVIFTDGYDESYEVNL